MTQDLLLRIVSTWNISEEPEYRGFRCANCQAYITSAWHHWLSTGGYKTPVHFCKKCQAQYLSEEIAIHPHPTNTSLGKIQNFTKKYPEKAEKMLVSIQEKWNLAEKPTYKPFSCDLCKKDLPNAKGYHTWFKHDETLIEEHFCRPCANKIGIG